MNNIDNTPLKDISGMTFNEKLHASVKYDDIEEKLPFQKFKSGEGVLVFYVSGHMFSFFDCNDFSVISLKCQPERIEDLKAQHECIGNPYNESPKHWIGINPATAPDELLKELTRNSYEIVKAKYRNRRSSESHQTRLNG